LSFDFPSDFKLAAASHGTIFLIASTPMAEKSIPTARIRVTGNYVLVCHGGAGTMTKSGSTPEQRAAYRAAIRAALEAGYKILSEGGRTMNTVSCPIPHVHSGR
jgi:hypothetical protein